MSGTKIIKISNIIYVALKYMHTIRLLIQNIGLKKEFKRV